MSVSSRPTTDTDASARRGARPSGARLAAPTLSAVLLVGSGVLAVVGAVTAPDLPGGAPGPNTALETVRAVVDHRAMYILSTVTQILSVGLLLVGLPALVDLAQGRRGRLAMTGGVISALGYAAMAGLAGMAGGTLVAVSGGGLDEATAAGIWSYASATEVFAGFALPFLLFVLVGSVLLGIGLITSGRAPTWLGILAIVSGIASVLGSVALQYPLTIVANLPLAALALAGGLLALRSRD